MNQDGPDEETAETAETTGDIREITMDEEDNPEMTDLIRREALMSTSRSHRRLTRRSMLKRSQITNQQTRSRREEGPNATTVKDGDTARTSV